MGDENIEKKDALASLLGDDDDEGIKDIDKFLNNQFDPQPRIKEIERLLKGEQWNGEKWEVPKGVEPLCNVQGAFIIISKITTLLNPDSINGYMNEDEFNELMIEFNFEMVRVINRDRKKLGIKKGMSKFVIDMIDHRIRTFLSGAINGRRATLVTHILSKKPLENSNKDIKKQNALNYLIN
jgi:hypothetical protein